MNRRHPGQQEKAIMSLGQKKVLFGVVFAIICLSAVYFMVTDTTVSHPSLSQAAEKTVKQPTIGEQLAADPQDALKVSTSKLSKQTPFGPFTTLVHVKIGIAVTVSVFVAVAILLGVYLYAQQQPELELEPIEDRTLSKVDNDSNQEEPLEETELGWKVGFWISAAVVVSLFLFITINYYIRPCCAQMRRAPKKAKEVVAHTPKILDADIAVDIYLFGDFKVGKTMLVSGYLGIPFSAKYRPTIGTDLSELKVSLDDQKVNLRLLDNFGEKSSFIFPTNTSAIVYSVTDLDSFNSVELWHQKSKPKNCILVANKVDDTENRVISQEDGQQKAKNLSCEYMETSAKSRENVKELFELAVRLQAN